MSRGQDAAERYERARQALGERAVAERAAGVLWQTPEFRELARDVWEAEPGVPWWRRRLIGRRVLRELAHHKRGLR